MFPRLRIQQLVWIPICALVALIFTATCSDSSTPTSPTSPAGTATILGTVVRGSGTLGTTAQSSGIGLSEVMVSVVSTNRSARTDASGDFTLTDVPIGNVALDFSRADIHARATVPVAAGTNAITVAVAGSTAVVVSRGHAGEEIEGLVSAIGTDALTVLDQRLGSVVVTTNSATVLRHGHTTITLSQIQIGMRVHVKALLQPDNTYLATEVKLQSDEVGGDHDVTGSVTSVNTADRSFIVQTAGAAVTVKTDSSTTFKNHGSSATFAAIAVGVMVEVEGVVQTDGSVLARQVEIE
jgi:hypothetical protein